MYIVYCVRASVKINSSAVGKVNVTRIEFRCLSKLPGSSFIVLLKCKLSKRGDKFHAKLFSDQFSFE